MNLDRIDGLMDQRDTFARNTWSPIEQMVREIRAPARADRRACNYDVKQRLPHTSRPAPALDRAVAHQSGRFRLPAYLRPHSPNVWSRIDDSYTQVVRQLVISTTWRWPTACSAKCSTTLHASPRWKDTHADRRRRSRLAHRFVEPGCLHGPTRTMPPHAASSTRGLLC